VKVFPGLKTLVFLALGLMALAGRVGAQGVWLNVGIPSSKVGISNNLTFTISVTNLTGVSQTIGVTNLMPAASQFVGVSFGLVSYPYTNIGSSVIFSVGALTNTGIAQMAVTISPTTNGSITNTVLVATNGVFAVGLSVVVQVTNALPVAELVVAMTGPASQVFSNDWMQYGVSVTNQGPDTAPGVYLTNTMPPGVGYKGVSPSNKTFSVSIQRSNVIFNLGTLTNQAFRSFQLTVQPTNVGTLTFVSTVSTNGVLNGNPANTSASLNVIVSNFLSQPGQLTAMTVSTQKFNQLSGRLEQNIVLSNAGPTSVNSARVTVTGLTNWLSNATGTNNGNPFVTYAASLAQGQSAYLLLQFYPTQNPFPFANSQLRADGVTMPNLAPPVSGLMPTNILLMARLPSGGMFLEFPTLTNQAFTVEYSSDLVNWLVAQPVTVTPANYTAWIDYGPPATVSHPTNAPMRFYRVFLGP